MSGAFAAWGSSWSKASERRHQRKLYRLKHQGLAVEQARSGEIQALLTAHDAVDKRWLEYELDAAKLIDYPMRTDVREPLTVAVDEAATPAERQTAYKRARRELDRLIVLPDATIASLEEKVARMLGAGPSKAQA